MLKWFSGEEGGAAQGAPGSPQGSAGGGSPVLSEVTEQLAQTQQLVVQLKEFIREKDAALGAKDEQLKTEKESCEAKLSKMRLQHKAKVTSLNAQLEELKKQRGETPSKGTPLKIKRSGSGELGEVESSAANRGKILLLKKKVEELDQQLSRRNEELRIKTQELEAQHERGFEMDAMLVEKDRKLAEKEAYIVHLQMAVSGEHTQSGPGSVTQDSKVQSSEDIGSVQELQLLVQSLTKKVGDGEERYSLLQEQADSLKALLEAEKAHYEENENMYKQNIQTFKDIIMQKDNTLLELNQQHEQELFKLAAKSDASADLEQLLKALKQKLHEKEEVLLGKAQVIEVLQSEVDGRDQQIKELAERMRRLQGERENLQSKLEAEKHVMRAQLRDLMQKHESELRRITEKHEQEMSEKEQALCGQLQDLQRSPAPPVTVSEASMDSGSAHRLSELAAQVKLKAEDASKSETKFLKMKAWSKSRIRQLEEELKKAQSGSSAPDVSILRSHVTELEEEREEMLCKLDQYDDLKAKNEVLEAKLVVYEEQQRKMQADLEQVTKRAASQASESGSVDELQSNVLEWQDMVSMVTDAEAARDQACEEKNSMALRMSHIEEEREGLIEDDWFFPGCSDPALANRQQELEEELAQARGLRHPRVKKMGDPGTRSLQEDLDFDVQQSFPDPSSPSGNTTPMEGENMGDGLRSVVEELEVERNQLQEQIIALEDRCQDLEDRLQLQARIESLQNESEKLQAQLATLRSQQTRDAEKHQLLVTSLNEQLKGLSDTQECLESSLIEKENTLAKTSEKLELIDSLRDALREKEEQHKDVSDRLLQTEHNLSDITKKCSAFEKQCSEMKTTVAELTQKLSLLKEKTQKQEAIIVSLQSDLDQTNDDLDKLNSTHLEERAQLIHDLQSCEREIDNLKDILLDKDKEISTLSGNITEYAEQILELKLEIRHKEEDLVRIEGALSKAEREAQIIRDSQSSDQQSLNAKMSELMEQLKATEGELEKAKEEKNLKMTELDALTKQVKEDRQTIQGLHVEIQKLSANHRSHLSECEPLVSSLKEQVSLGCQKSQESEGLLSQLKDTAASNEKLKEELLEKEQSYIRELKSFKDERNTLLAEANKQNDDLQSLSKQLEEQVEHKEEVNRVVLEKSEVISSLEQQLKNAQEDSEGQMVKLNAELKAKDVDKEKLEKELAAKSESISKIKVHLKNLKAEKQKLQRNIEEKSQESKIQKQQLDDVTGKIETLLKQNSEIQLQVNSLTDDNGKLHQEIEEKVKRLSGLVEERDTFLNKVSTFEKLHSKNCKIIQELTKQKYELNLKANDLSKGLEQSKQSVTESLLEKTNECNELQRLLQESQISSSQLKDQVENLQSQVDHLNINLQESEKNSAERNLQIEAQQTQVVQLQETLSLLQEQGTALKSGLMEKDTMFQRQATELSSLQSELQQQKDYVSRLQSESETLKGECSRYNETLEEKEATLRTMTQDCQSHTEELNKRIESVVSLSSQLGTVHENNVKLESDYVSLKASLDMHVSENSTLKEAVAQRYAEVVALQNHDQAAMVQNQQLRSLYDNKEKELNELQQVASELNKKVALVTEQNGNLESQVSSLCEQSRKLQQENDDVSKLLFSAGEESNTLQNKLSGLEMQHSENRKIIEGLMKDKEELSLRTEELNNVLEQNKQSTSGSLLEKTSECNDLKKSLGEREETVISLQRQVEFSDSQVNNLKDTLSEKERVCAEQSTRLQTYSTQVAQLQETLSLLQEQGTALKSGLMEKDTMFQRQATELSSLQTELQQQKDYVSRLLSESETLRGECSRFNETLEEKEATLRNKIHECQSITEELNKRKDSIVSLSSQLGNMNENVVRLETENADFKCSVKNHISENAKLKEEVQKTQDELLDLRDTIQALNEQNGKLKAEIQKTVVEASDKMKEIINIKNELSVANKFKEDLQLTLQQKEESLKQQDMLINQLQAKSNEGEGEINQRMETIVVLQKETQSLHVALQSKDTLLFEKERDLTVLKDKLTLELDESKTQQSKIKEELHSKSERTNQLNVRVAEQDAQLKQKVDECMILKEQVSELSDSNSLLQIQVETLTSNLKENELVIQDVKSASSAHSNSLNDNFKAKESECESLKEQVSSLSESIAKLKDNLSAQTSKMSSLQLDLEESRTSIAEQRKCIDDLQRRADESALFKTQFMESTEQATVLQRQILGITKEYENLTKLAEERQSALMNLQEKFASHSEELQIVKTLLSQRNDEISNLNTALTESREATVSAEKCVISLRHETTSLQDELQQLRASNANLSKQKDEALSTHERSSMSLTVEIEKLKSQHLHVASQVNALTENLEQREMALHAINSQYSAQVKRSENLVSELEKLSDLNKSLQEEMERTKEGLQQKLDLSTSERVELEKVVKKLSVDKEKHEKSHYNQIQVMEEQLQHQIQQQSSNMSEVMESMKLEKEHLQVQVSVKGEELTGLKSEIQRIEQTLQESEKEWLFVLDRETQDKNSFKEKLETLENEIMSKDSKVHGLQQDLDHLNEKLGEATSALNVSSERLKEKESDALTSKSKLEEFLSTVQAKDKETLDLRNALQDMEKELRKLECNKQSADENLSEITQTMSDQFVAIEEEKSTLQNRIKELQKNHQSEVTRLREELQSLSVQLQQKQRDLSETEKLCKKGKEELVLLQDKMQSLQLQLLTDAENLKEAGVKQTTSLNEIQHKDDKINCMNIQISQQKELITGLSQQLKDKDLSVTQVLTAASNERMKYTEEKNSLLTQIESLEKSQNITIKELEDVSNCLEETKIHMSLCQNEIKDKDVEIKHFVKEKEELKTEFQKLTKDKEAMKKKLQAALVVRKELLKKIENYEQQRTEDLKMSDLQDKFQELLLQSQTAETEHKALVDCLQQQLELKNTEILEFAQVVSGKDELIKQQEKHIESLRGSLQEQEVSLTTSHQTLEEKGKAIENLKANISEKEQNNSELLINVEQLKREIEEKEECWRDQVEGSKVSSVAAESELVKVTQEKAVLHRKAHAALLARKETIKKAQESEKKYMQEISERKDDFEALLEKHCQQTNELNAMQLKYEDTVKELEESRHVSTSLQSKLEKLIEQRDDVLQDLRLALDGKDSQAITAQTYIEEMKVIQHSLEKANTEIARKDMTLVTLEKHSTELENCLREIKEITDQLEEQKQEIENLQHQNQHEKQITIEQQSQLHKLQSLNEELRQKLKELEDEREEQSQELENFARRRSEEQTLELETALAKKSEELESVQNSSVQTQMELERVHSQWLTSQTEVESCKLLIESLQQEKNTVFKDLERNEKQVTMFESQLKELQKQNYELLQKIEAMEIKQSSDIEVVKNMVEESLKTSSDPLDVNLNGKDADLLALQAVVTEKDEHISALEQQLQRQIHLHELAMNKMRTEVNELQQRSRQVGGSEQANENKPSEQLTKKLQAALISRKEALKENHTVKEKNQALSSENERIRTTSAGLEHAVAELRQQKTDLETTLFSLRSDKEQVIAEVERVSSENHSLSAACGSLKLTIESITQQKEAFSCQLESLKDSQTVELSEWKSKHTELKQEYESLLQAYENVGSEMDKMRQLMEGARRERQEAILKAHKAESERQNLEKQICEVEEENEKIKDKMRKFAKVKQQRMEELEEENATIRQDLNEYNEKEKSVVEQLTVKNQQLEAEMTLLKDSSQELRLRFNEIQLENQNMARELETASSSLEKWHDESKSSENNLQLQLKEAFNLNNSLTAQIEAEKAEMVAQQEIIEAIQKEKVSLSEKFQQLQMDHEAELKERDKTVCELNEVVNRNGQETISLNEKVRILEDDKCLLQEELENAQEISDKVKNESEYLETVLLKNSERIDELTQMVNVLQSQNSHLMTQLTENKEEKAKALKEKEEQHLKLVKAFEEKLKTVQRGSEGSKNIKKELQELLKEKHQEINQLQSDYIRYQELILNLERSLKNSNSAQQKMEKDLEENNKTITEMMEQRKKLEDELSNHQNFVGEAKTRLASYDSEKDQLHHELERKNELFQSQMKEKEGELGKIIDQQKSIHKDKLMELQRRIDELLHHNEKESEVSVLLKSQVDHQDLQIKRLTRELETNSAKLAVLSVKPDSVEPLNHWNDIFQKSLHDKDAQLLEQSNVITRLLEDGRGKGTTMSEMQMTIKRLERALNDYTVASSAQQRQIIVMSASNTELSQNVEFFNRQLLEQSAQIERFESEKTSLNRQLSDKTDSSSQMQSNLEYLEKNLSDAESQLTSVKSQHDKLLADFEKQEAMLSHMKTLLQNKDAEISSLLSSRDGQMSGYLEQLQANHRTQVEGYEERLNGLYNDQVKTQHEFRRLESKVKSLQGKIDRSIQEKEQMATQMETFKNSMASLQNERDRLMSEHRTLQQTVAMHKESSAEGDLGPSKGLKGEIKTLLHQMDDLNSENAMLKAQLIRYREDLNQVLSLKDNQLKELLRKQQDSIKSLETQKVAVEKQHREAVSQLQVEGETVQALKTQNSNLHSQVKELEASIIALHKEILESDKGKVIHDLQQAVAAKASECNNLQQKVFTQKVAADDLKLTLEQLKSETQTKLREAESMYNSERQAIERKLGLMRNERETAEQRVAELARDLMQTEQVLSESRNQGKDLKSQNESLGKAMVALQNDREQLIDNFKVLQSRYNAELREMTAAMNKMEWQLRDLTSELTALTTQRNVLVQELQALEGKDPQSQLTDLVNDLTQTISEKEVELQQVSLENSSYNKQVAAFSKAMASLQNDRDRLIEELTGAKKALDSRQQSSPDTVGTLRGEKWEILSRSVNTLQTERDGLLKEVENLRSVNAELAEFRHKYDDQQMMLQQAQAYRAQIDQNVSLYQAESAELRADNSRLLSEVHTLKDQARIAQPLYPSKESMTLLGKHEGAEPLSQLQAERVQLHRDLQRCLQEIHQRDLLLQQLNTKLGQVIEEKSGVSVQLKAVSQTLRDTQLNLSEVQNRYYWLENQVQTQQAPAQSSSHVEVAPGAPQEKSSAVVDIDGAETGELRSRLTETELQLDTAQQSVSQLTDRLEEERGRREAAEEALGFADATIKSMEARPSGSPQRDFSIQLETDDEWEALILDPNQHVVMRKMKGGVLALRRWIRGRSLYCSRMLTSKAKSRYLFLSYLLILHVLVFMCLSGAL
ncbi:golgin subfamily B member 1-like isoform X1 [Clupea harengus]|uniref:Golgin subfamily B member 1-like isoform X1 n=1 Tax=Clupea harengus TaxID=7950 RepID=A0A6P8FPF3_CLUHA|nr:golgin subfamily B member 1-like isoform X1 [Clupea harengus]